MTFVTKFAFGSLLVGSIAWGQAPSEPATSAATPALPLPDPPTLPRAKATLIGGTVERLDRVRDQVTVRVFGGGRMNILFDPRTRVYQGRAQGTPADPRVGERVYLDTILDGDTVFAGRIRLQHVQAVGESQ